MSILVANLVLLPKVFAGTLTNTSILQIGGTSNVTPMIVSTGQAFIVVFRTASAGATTMSINFDNFSGGTVDGSQTIASAGCTDYYPSATVLPGSLSASGSGNTISVTGITSLSSATTYCTVLTSVTAITNPSSAGVYSALVTVGADSNNAAFDVLATSTSTVTIAAIIAASFTFSLNPFTSDSIGTLSATALTVSTGVVATISTNAASGWNLWAKDSNAGLNSSTAAYTIPSVTPGTNVVMDGGSIGTEKYALGVSSFFTTNYEYGGSSNRGGGLSSSAFNHIATSASAASGATTTLRELVDISATTPPAADYTDTITVIGAGSF